MKTSRWTENTNKGGFNGNVTLDDENGAIQLNGAINTAGKTPTFNFHAAVSHFRPNTLHLTPKYKDTELSVKIKADFTGSSINDMNGEINIDSLQYTAPDQNFFMDNLRIAATQNDEHQKRLTINSNFLRGTIEGDYSYQTLPRQRTEHHAALHPRLDITRQASPGNSQ